MANQMPAILGLLGQRQSLDALGRGHDSAVKRFDTNYYDPYTSAFSGAPGTYAKSFGVGGAPGFDEAFKAFQESPTYQAPLAEGEKAILRNAASRGMLTSGNASQDLIRFGQDYAARRLGDFQSGLSDLSRLGLGAAEGETGRQRSLADLDTGFGTKQADVFQNTTNSLMDLYKPQPQQPSGIGSAIAGGLNLAGTIAGLGLRR